MQCFEKVSEVGKKSNILTGTQYISENSRILARLPRFHRWFSVNEQFPKFWQKFQVFNSVAMWFMKIQSLGNKSKILTTMQWKSRSSMILASWPKLWQWCNVFEESSWSWQQTARCWQELPVFSSDARYFKKLQNVGKKSEILAVTQCISRSFKI